MGFRLLWMGFLGLLPSALAFGIWSSGGGDTHLDQGNPWFLGDVATVSYCLEQSPDFTVHEDESAVVVMNAFAYWQEEFGFAAYVTKDRKRQQGTQNFQPTEDCSNADIRFQFGNLHPDQLAWLQSQGKKRQDFVGIAVRTHYDSRNMRGKGFIYISPDFGPNAFSRKSTKPIWADGSYGNLHKILVHELGHVFGIPHSNNEEITNDVMATQYPKAIGSGKVRGGSNINTIPGYFQNRHTFGSSGYLTVGVRDYTYDQGCGNQAADFYGLAPTGFSGVTFLRDPAQSNILFTYAGSIFGSITLDQKIQDSYTPVVKYFLPENQTRFPNYGDLFAVGANSRETLYSGTFRNDKNATERQVTVTLSPKYYKFGISGIMAGKVAKCITNPLAMLNP